MNLKIEPVTELQRAKEKEKELQLINFADKRKPDPLPKLGIIEGRVKFEK